MDRDDAKHAIKVLRAWLDGKTVQARAKNSPSSEWITLTQWAPDDFVNYDYRIKPVPREWILFATQEGGMLHVASYAPQDAHSVIRVREILE